jgi:hypothetical protein
MLVAAAAATGAAAALLVRQLDERRADRWRAELATALISRPSYENDAGLCNAVTQSAPPRLALVPAGGERPS